MQKISLYEQEIQDLQERDKGQKRMYDVMFGALEDAKTKSDSKENSTAILEEYQRKISDLESELQQVKSESKKKLTQTKEELQSMQDQYKDLKS